MDSTLQNKTCKSKEKKRRKNAMETMMSSRMPEEDQPEKHLALSIYDTKIKKNTKLLMSKLGNFFARIYLFFGPLRTLLFRL